MKTSFLFAALTVLLFACNNSTETTTTTTDSAHDTHDPAPAGSQVNDNTTAMQQAMNTMMSNMHSFKATGDADHDFASLMKMHHQSAVEMARIVVQHGTDTAVKSHAQNTITEQQREIEAFDKFLQSKTPSGNSEYGKNAMQMMTHSNHTDSTASLEALYATMMIPHHQDGVKMAQEYLKVGKDAGLKRIAQSIIQTQPKEIEDYKAWLKK